MTRPHAFLLIAALLIKVDPWPIAGRTAAASVSRVEAPAQIYPAPMPAPSLVNVQGRVSIENQPTVIARQDGIWSVGVIGEPAVTLSTPAFVEAGREYTVTWPADSKPRSIRVIAVRKDGWIEAETLEGGASGVKRWLNVNTLATIEDGRR